MQAKRVDREILGIALSMLIGSGCSFEDAVPDWNTGDTGTTGAAGTDSSLPEPDTTEGPLDDTTTATTANESDEDGTGEFGCDIDCGAGYCELDDEDSPTCVCDPGHAAYGLRCLPCDASTGNVELDIPRVELNASFLLQGESFPDVFSENGIILLRDPATGDEIELGETSNGGTNELLSVLPGSYEVLYRRLLGGNAVPLNSSAKIDTITIPDEAAFDFEVDVPMVELSGNFYFNAVLPPEFQSENGTILLVNEATGDEVELGETVDSDYTARVVPGLYSVRYRRRLAEQVAPINGNAHIAYVDVHDTGQQLLDIDVSVTSLDGAITLDGATPPAFDSQNGRIWLRDPDTGDLIALGQTSDGSYDAPVVTGDYDIIYQRLLGDQVPINSFALVDQVTLDFGTQTLDIDIPTAMLTGEITVGGGTPPTDPANDGVVLLRNPDTGDEAVLSNTTQGSYSRRVVLGQYDVYYRQETSSGGVPVNTNALLQQLTVRGPADTDIDIPMVTVNASVTVGGQAPPDSSYDDGLLYLRNLETGDSVLLGNTRLATLQRPVVPGTYEVHYVVEAAGPTMPVNAQSRLDTVEIGPVTQLDVDIPVVDFYALVTLAGDPTPDGVYDRALLMMHDVTTADVINLGTIETGELRKPLTAGTYVVAYRQLITNGAVPSNRDAGIACVELTTP